MPRTHFNIVATIDTSIGRLPANIEAERSILGAILLDNHAYNDAAEPNGSTASTCPREIRYGFGV